MAGFLAVFFLPVYFPLVLSFRIKSQHYKEVRWALRIASLPSLGFLFVRAPGLRPIATVDGPSRMQALNENGPIVFLWIWGGSIGVIVVCIMLALLIHRARVAGNADSARPSSSESQARFA
jgi:hypothetical protein